MNNYVEELSKQAAVHLKTGNLRQAQKIFSRICSIQPNMADAWSDLAKVSGNLGDFTASETAFRQLVTLSPNLATAHCNLGLVLQQQGKHDEAIACYQQAIKLSPERINGYYNLGNALRVKGDMASAIRAYRKAYEITPQYGNVWYILASLLTLQFQLDDALSIFQESLHINPDSAQLLDAFSPETGNVTTHSVDSNTGHETIGLTIATSIAPRKIEVQQKAIASWKELGFHVVSLNSREEIQQIRQYFNDVEFVTINRDAREMHKKPYVYFDDVLAFFKGSNEAVCGIVNSDIILKGEKLGKFIKREALGSFLYGCRVDVASHDQLEGEVYKYGFDYFFFDRQFLETYPPEEFCIGLPWWDFWAVLVPLLRRIPVKKLTTQIAFHVKHDTNWSPESWVWLAGRISKYIGVSDTPTAQTTNYYVNYVWLLIERHSKKIQMSESF